MDNSATHGVEVTAPDVDIIFLPPNTTAVYQPMDAGVIAALKRRYKRRLLAIIVRAQPVALIWPVSPPPQTPLPKPSPTPPPFFPAPHPLPSLFIRPLFPSTLF